MKEKRKKGSDEIYVVPGLPVMLTPAQLARRLHIDEPRLCRMRKRKEGPKCVVIGRNVRYLGPDVAEWEESLKAAQGGWGLTDGKDADPPEEGADGPSEPSPSPSL